MYIFIHNINVDKRMGFYRIKFFTSFCYRLSPINEIEKNNLRLYFIFIQILLHSNKANMCADLKMLDDWGPKKTAVLF